MTTDLTLLTRVAHRGQEVTAPRVRALLALLAGELRLGCSADRLVAGMWPQEVPERPGKALQVVVSRARGQLGAEVIASTPTGYRLALGEEQVDSSALLVHAAASAERARAGDHPGALAAAEAGLALWQGAGEAAGGADDPVAALRAERAPVREGLVRARALALARLGRHAEAAGPLAVAAAAHPRDEEVLAELLRGEAATAGPSAALTRYEAYRRALREELGTEPGAGLKALQRELLRGEAPVVRHGVPHEPNPLLGRDEDIAAVERLLRASRAVTVVGPGGLGKTRLAHAVSRGAEQRVVHFVPLAGVTADGDVAAQVAAALGAGEGRPGAVGGHAPVDPVPAILGVLGSGAALLVLDNCEQVVGGAADLVRALVSSSKDLRVLATSRSPLGLSSEAVYALPELGLDTSVELFTQRARAARPGVVLPPRAVAELCRHLDGLPLAVELAAARVRVLSVPEIARRLGDRFALLRGGARDLPERHRTLHAVVEWSWNLLAEDARAALLTLAVFPGGFCGEAAEHVLGADALSLLEQVVEQSLLTVADTPAGVRFRMLETVREFAAARCAEAGEQDAAVGRFLAWARDFGVAHHAVLFGPGPRAAWERIRPEQDNLVLALRHALARADGRSTAALTAVLAALWSNASNFPRLAALAEESGPPLSHYRPEPEDVEVARAAAVVCAAGLLMGQGPRAVRQLVTLRRLPAARPDTLLRATAVVLSAIPAMRPPDYDVLRGLCDADSHREQPPGSVRPIVPGARRRPAAPAADVAARLDARPNRPRTAQYEGDSGARPAGPTQPRGWMMGAPPGRRLGEPHADPTRSTGQTLVAGVAECVASYVWEYEHDIDRALAAARRMASALAPVDNPSVRLLRHSRLGELCLRTGQGEAAYQNFRAALDALPGLGDGHDHIGMRSTLVLACLQRGEPDEAEYWLRQAAVDDDNPQQLDAFWFYGTDLGGRAEIALARGLTEVGLGLWRSAVERLLAADQAFGGEPWFGPWALMIQAVAVTAHAHAGRLELVAGPLDRLRQQLRTLVLGPVGSPTELPGLALVLHALGTAGLTGGDTGAVRMIALAERLRVPREFQPTMSAARARRAAEEADRAAYTDALSAYAALERDELWAAARALTSGRG